MEHLHDVQADLDLLPPPLGLGGRAHHHLHPALQVGLGREEAQYVSLVPRFSQHKNKNKDRIIFSSFFALSGGEGGQRGGEGGGGRGVEGRGR